MQFYGGDETTETQRFIKMFDKYAALMSIDVREPDLKPYTCSSDERLTVSLCVPTIKDWYVYSSDFLGYLKEWETGREGFTNAQKTTMMLSRETL